MDPALHAATTDDPRPLLLFYDCEAAAGNVFRDDIIEVAVKCQPDLHPTAEFDSLVHTNQRICDFGQKNGLTRSVLEGQPRFPEVLAQLLDWCDAVVTQVNQLTNCSHFPVLVAHGGELFDFLMLFSHCERHGISVDRLREHRMHFADTFIHLDQVKRTGHQLLDGCPLSLDFLLNEWFPGQFAEGRHRAMVDVTLLIKMFYETPLHQFLTTLPIFSTDEWYEFYETKKAIKKDTREFGDQLSFLSEVERKFAVKSLVKNGLNYAGLKDLYQQCCSPEHFKHEMRDLMDRNVKTMSIGKITRHFLCQNLPQLGTIPYQPPSKVNCYQPACYHETDATGTHFRLRYGQKGSRTALLPSQQPQEDSPLEAEEANPDSSSYPVGTRASRGVTPAARGRGRGRPQTTRDRNAGWVYNPLHKQVPVEFGNHDDGWHSDEEPASYTPDYVTHGQIQKQKAKVTTTLVAREGRSTIFDMDDDIATSQRTQEKGHLKHQKMSFGKIKEELEKSGIVVRGKGARDKQTFQEKRDEETVRKAGGMCKEHQNGRGSSATRQTSEKSNRRMPEQNHSQQEVERSSGDRVERSATNQPVCTYAQVAADVVSGKEGDTKAFHPVDKRAQARVSDVSTPVSQGFETAEDHWPALFVSKRQPHRKHAEKVPPSKERSQASWRRRSKSGVELRTDPADNLSSKATGSSKETDSVNSPLQNSVQQDRPQHRTKEYYEEKAVNQQTSTGNYKEEGRGSKKTQSRKWSKPKEQWRRNGRQNSGAAGSSSREKEMVENDKVTSYQSPVKDVQQQQISNSKNQQQYNKAVDRPKVKHEHFHGNRKVFDRSVQQARGEKEACTVEPSSRDGKKCRCGLEGKQLRGRFYQPGSNRKPRSFGAKNCYCGLAYEAGVPNSSMTKPSQIVGAREILEASSQQTRSKKGPKTRPYSAKYGILSSQDGRKKGGGLQTTDKDRIPDVDIDELLPFKNEAYKYLFTPITDMDASTAEEYDKLIFMYNQEYFKQEF